MYFQCTFIPNQAPLIDISRHTLLVLYICTRFPLCLLTTSDNFAPETLGHPGDSHAAVLDAETCQFSGGLWRNSQYGDPRVLEPLRVEAGAAFGVIIIGQDPPAARASCL